MVELHVTTGADRVRENTAEEPQQELDTSLVERISKVAHHRRGVDGQRALTARIAELEQESDIERVLAANAGALALIGTILATVHHRRWLLVPAVVTTFLIQHAVQGWCPPIALFRRLGIRTRQEIDAERYAVKLLRGDFGDVPEGSDEALARHAVSAVSA
jgi:hypothetical protein